MNILTIIGRRSFYAITLILAVIVLNFVLIHLAPGDPAEVIAGEMGGATAEILADMGLESPFDLLGLYQSVSLDRKSVAATPTDVDMIFLYRRPILEYWFETGETLAAVVRHVLIHEIGHHFGFSDVDMHRIEADTGVSADGTD